MSKLLSALQTHYYIGRAAARSDQKISRQLPQASARLRQRKRRTVKTCTVKRSSEQNTPKILLWSNLFVCAVEKIVFYIHNCAKTKVELIKFAVITANCVGNNLENVVKILNNTENNDICSVGSFYCRTL